jgi:hypothetical protein
MKKFLILTLIMSLAAVSCGRKEVEIVTEDSRIATEAITLIQTVKEAYIKRDLRTIEKNTTKDGFRVISGNMKMFDSAELTFNPVLIEIRDDIVRVNISWRGTWKQAGKSSQEGGMSVFILKGRPLKIDNILMASPFVHPE